MHVRQLPSRLAAGGVRLSSHRRDSVTTPGRAQKKRRQIDVFRAGVGDMLSKYVQGLFTKDNRLEDTSNETEQRNLYFSNNAPEWAELKTLVEREGELVGDPSLTQNDYLETGPPNPLSLKRTFGKSDPIRVKLYRDHAAWCPYCQKVWIQLEEKQIPYIIEKINMRCYGDKPASFYEKTSSGLLPVMEFEGKVITESAVIAQILEDAFPERPLLPPEETAERSHCNQLFRLERMAFSAWCQWLCQSWAPERQRANFETVLKKIEQELVSRGGPFFLGEQFSLVDIFFAPFLERMDASLTFYKGFRMRGQGKYPCLETWFAAMEARPTYIATKTDYYTHAFALPPQLGGCVMTDEGEPFAKTICGKDGAWSLPLEPLSVTSFEPYSLGDDPKNDRYYAAKRLISNHEAVVKFALRACGEEVDRRVTAPLSNPTAQPGMHAFMETDTALRHIAHSLLVGVDDKQTQSSKIITQADPEDNMLPSANVILALKYLRDHVGVPRDLRFPEARQLRAHVNWMIDQVI